MREGSLFPALKLRPQDFRTRVQVAGLLEGKDAGANLAGNLTRVGGRSFRRGCLLPLQGPRGPSGAADGR